MTESDLNQNEVDLLASLEALLFVSPEPVALTLLATFLGKSIVDIENGLHALEEVYQHKRGVCLQWHGGRVQMTTSPLLGGLVEKFLGLDLTSRLSRPALETLAIVAYQQPITRPQIDAIRGVNSDGVLKNLLNKGLVQEEGRSEGPGRPIMYGTTADFLQYFGLSSLEHLPLLDVIADSTVTTSKGQEILKG
jgi:segregation and condensation protein B